MTHPRDHPYPVPLDDLRERVRRSSGSARRGRIVVQGTSSGANLAAALIVRVRDDSRPPRSHRGIIRHKPNYAGIRLAAGRRRRWMAALWEGTRHRNGGVDPEKRRFEYVASETEILFRDHGDSQPRSRRVFAFHRPETLRRWLGEPETLRGRLRPTSFPAARPQ
jgi:acetyl esterase/lipase